MSPFVLPSFLFVLSPWLWPDAVGLTIGIGLHAVWLLACELMVPAARAPAPAPSPPAVRAVRPGTHRPEPFTVTTVLAVLDEASTIRTFRLARPAALEFAPGQFLPVRVLVDGRPHVRCYSISSAPHTRGYVEISVRRQGLVSGMLHASLRAGSTLTIGRPAGHFVYPAGDDRPLALIAGGIGITPLRSMVRHAVEADPMRPITLFYSVRHEGELAFRGELAVLAERHPQVRVVVTLTRPTAPTRLRTGRMDAALLRQHVTAPAHTVFCLCGPGPMVDDVVGVLASLGVPAGQIRREAFDAAATAAQVNPAAFEPVRTAPDGRDVEVTFAVSGRSVVAPASRTLLETAEAEGVPIASSCRSGVCQSCRTRLAAGAAECRSDVIHPDDRAAGYILPCVSWPTSDCVLEA